MDYISTVTDDTSYLSAESMLITANGTSDEDFNSPPPAYVIVLHYSVKLTLIVIGFTSNVIAAILLLHSGSRLRKCAVGHLLAAICISDAVFLAAALPIWIAQVFPFSKADWHNRDGMCEFLSLMTSASSFLSTWYTVSLAVERYLSVWWRPAERSSSSTLTQSPSNEQPPPSTVCGTLTARIAIIALGILATCIFLNMSVNMGVDRQINECMPFKNSWAAMHVLFIIDLFVNVFVPYAAVIILYSVSYVGLAAIRRRVCGTSGLVRRPDGEGEVQSASVGDPSTYPQLHPAEMRLTKLSVVLSAVVLAFQLPQHSGRTVRYFIDVPWIVEISTHILFYISFTAPLFVLIAVHSGVRRKLVLSIAKACSASSFCFCNR